MEKCEKEHGSIQGKELWKADLGNGFYRNPILYEGTEKLPFFKWEFFFYNV